MLSLFTQTSFSQVQVNDETAFYEFKYDKGLIKESKVESITVSQYDRGKMFSQAKYFFDTLGLLIKKLGIDALGKKTTEFYFDVNSNGDLIYIKEFSYSLNKTYETFFFKQYSDGKLVRDSSIALPAVYEYHYNNSGRLEQLVMHSTLMPGTRYVIFNKYDSANKVKEIFEKQFNNSSDTTGVIISHRLLFYNSDERIIREEEMIHLRYVLPTNNGSKRYTYDEKGNLTEIIKSGSSSKKYTYNDRGLIVTGQTKIVFTDKELFDNSESNSDMEVRYKYNFRN